MAEIFKSIELRSPARADIERVVANLRDDDVREIYAIRFNDDPESLADELTGMVEGAAMFVAVAPQPQGDAVALMGIWEPSPGVGLAFMMATPEFPRVVKDLTRFIRRELIQRLERAGFRRVEVRAMQDLSRNTGWIAALGARPETPLDQLGKHGEAFDQFAWLKGENSCASRA